MPILKPEILTPSFYKRDDVVLIARELLGKFLCTSSNGVNRCGMITETEAYAGITDRASHAYGGRETARTRIMFMQGGVAYVYLCYGVHSLFNVVTNLAGIPHAVLIRAVRVNGIDKTLTNGPGKVTKHLSIHYSQSGLPLSGPEIWIENRNFHCNDTDILVSRRIGVDYAGADANLPYRFQLLIKDENR